MADHLPVFVRVVWSNQSSLLCTCDNFDRKNEVCLDYENRPDFCRKAGTNGNFPNKDCRLRRPEDYTFADDFLD